MRDEARPKPPDLLVEDAQVERPLQKLVTYVVAVHRAQAEAYVGRLPMKFRKGRGQLVAELGLREADPEFAPIVRQVALEGAEPLHSLERIVNVGNEVLPRLGEDHLAADLLKEPHAGLLLELAHLEGKAPGDQCEKRGPQRAARPHGLNTRGRASLARAVIALHAGKPWEHGGALPERNSGHAVGTPLR